MNKNEVIRCCDSPMFVLKTADFIKCQKGIFDNNQQKGDLMSKNNRRKATMKQPRTAALSREQEQHIKTSLRYFKFM